MEKHLGKATHRMTYKKRSNKEVVRACKTLSRNEPQPCAGNAGGFTSLALFGSDPVLRTKMRGVITEASS